jgi:hypothetical protein
VSDKCDVYSFDVVLLEVVIGNHPKELLDGGLSSVEQPTLVKEIKGQCPTTPKTMEEKSLVVPMKLAFSCLQSSRIARPTMQEAYQTVTKRLSSSSFCVTFSINKLQQVRNAY